MNYPAFFDDAPHIRVRDPLADFLGAAEGGVLEYSYTDAVRLAGHSCPTVAGSWLLARAALMALYPDETPVRGGVAVSMPAPADEGVTGVMAQVFTLVTGAASDNGFHGIGGQFVRHGLLEYANAPGAGAIRCTRTDTGASVSVALDLSSVPPSPDARALMGAAMHPDATAAQRAAFGQAWQDRVRRLLLDHADDPAVVRVTRLS
jgi:hypothetical protein